VELSATDASEVAAILAPIVDMDDPASIGAYAVLVVDTNGMLHSTATDNIPPRAFPAFLELVADVMREFIGKVN
jgi:hypothetical protein